MKKLIYVAGPISKGPIDEHVRSAVHMGDRIMERGHAAFLPQLSILWQFVTPHTWEEWLQMDDTVIRKCDALFRMPGYSKGADREMCLARAINIPVFTTVDELEKWLDIQDLASSQERSRSNVRAFHTHGGKL